MRTSRKCAKLEKRSGDLFSIWSLNINSSGIKLASQFENINHPYLFTFIPFFFLLIWYRKHFSCQEMQLVFSRPTCLPDSFQLLRHCYYFNFNTPTQYSKLTQKGQVHSTLTCCLWVTSKHLFTLTSIIV